MTAGIGSLVTGYRTVLDSPHVFVAVLFVVLVSILFNAGARWPRWPDCQACNWVTAGRAQPGLEPEAA